MPSIDIHRKHPHSLKRAKEAVNDTAAAMREKFDIESSWSGNTLNFSRAGVDGKIRVTADDIHVTAELGFLLGMLKPAIEREIERHLDQHFK
ncbi:MAG TPA: polyhydroxyalkanoic acid system family protein [Rudaea sp.]|jgi:putative polyhydroxyalkanoate system protein|nr:polyhydroxyalkanoic acid system family protein [Rudaea sp.]